MSDMEWQNCARAAVLVALPILIASGVCAAEEAVPLDIERKVTHGYATNDVTACASITRGSARDRWW
jgi:hypothetical protein